jgi:hypothetical protein
MVRLLLVDLYINEDLTYDEQRACNGELIISYLPRTKKVDFMELNCSKLSTTDYDNLLDKNIISC